jgi:hypothetical protein
MEKVYNKNKPAPRPGSLRDRERRADEDRPRFVRGENATPERLGNPDDVAWAIAQEMEKFFYDEGIITGKNAAWLFKRGQDALDRSAIRINYAAYPERFRDGDGKQLSLADFGRNVVRYFKKNAPWGYCNNVEDVLGMFYDPVTLDDCAKGLWRVYRDRRKRKGIQ